MKKITAIILMLVLLLAFSACGSKDVEAEPPIQKKIIGIIQYGSHASLNNCYQGILAGLSENGINLEDYEIRHVNSDFDIGVSKAQAKELVDSNAAVIITIATPSAIAAANLTAESNIPVVYCAVTDAAVMLNYHNVTGSSDIPNFEKQLELVTAFMGKKKLKIGVMYSPSESSSPFQLEKLKDAAEKYKGMQIFDTEVADISEIDIKTNELIDKKVDCFINLLDNTIVGKLESNILPITNEKKIPIFGSEIEQVKAGCIASASIEYADVGFAAGKSAAEVLGGKNVVDIPVAYITEPSNYYNSEALAKFKLKLPAKITATDVVKQ